MLASVLFFLRPSLVEHSAKLCIFAYGMMRVSVDYRDILMLGVTMLDAQQGDMN